MRKAIASLMAIFMISAAAAAPAHAHSDASPKSSVHDLQKAELCDTATSVNLGAGKKSAVCVASSANHQGSHDDCPECRTCHHVAAVMPSGPSRLVCQQLSHIDLSLRFKVILAVLDGPVKPPRA